MTPNERQMTQNSNFKQFLCLFVQLTPLIVQPSNSHLSLQYKIKDNERNSSFIIMVLH